MLAYLLSWEWYGLDTIRRKNERQNILTSQEGNIMKTVPALNASTARETTTPLLPIKVCMHVLGCARTDNRVLREAKTLVTDGFAVSIVDIDSKGIYPFEEDIQGICVKHILMPRSFMKTRFKKRALFRAANVFIRSTFHLLQSSADIYHAHDVTALPACYTAAMIRRKPLVFDAHELPLSEIRVRSGWLSKLSERLLIGIVRRCSGIITVSPPIAQEICSRFHASKVSLIRNIPPYQVIPKSNQLRQHLGLRPEVRIALYQGNIQSNRGLDKLIRSAAFLEQDIAIVMMGNEVDSTLTELKALAIKETVTDRIKIIPAVPYTQLLEWTTSADIGLIIYEPLKSLNVQMCLPNKLFEYLMAGLPILATQLEAVSEVLSAYNVGRLVSSLAPAEVGAAINTMLKDRDALTCMSRNALEVAQHEFCWENEKQTLIHLYHEILSSG
jgi:glycosyltransferase involved in cell wall biosynthesis